MEYAVELKGVNKHFKDFALEDLDLYVKQGHITGFVGANGAGKSTTMKLMMNLLTADSGEINIFGKRYADYEKEIKERIGFVYDSNIFYESLTLKDMRKIIAPAYKNWSDMQFYKYIKLFELPLNKAIKKFSKGMQMKTSLAMALSHDAEFIIMDEPTAGLDPVSRRELLDILKKIMADGRRTIFFSTHITTDVERLADNIAFIRNGKMLFNDSIENVREHYALVKGDIELLNPELTKNFISVERFSTEFQALTNNAGAVRETLGNQIDIEQADLEDIMFYVKGEENHYV